MPCPLSPRHHAPSQLSKVSAGDLVPFVVAQFVVAQHAARFCTGRRPSALYQPPSARRFCSGRLPPAGELRGEAVAFSQPPTPITPVIAFVGAPGFSLCSGAACCAPVQQDVRVQVLALVPPDLSLCRSGFSAFVVAQHAARFCTGLLLLTSVTRKPVAFSERTTRPNRSCSPRLSAVTVELELSPSICAVVPHRRPAPP
jgi:hypothetical protein